MRTDTPAVVLGAGVNGLGVARSLARAHVPTCLLDTDVRRPEMQTRVATCMGIGSLHGEALVDELVRLGKTRFGDMRPVLFLTQEESVKMVSRARERLMPLYRFCLPPKDTLDAMLHKHGFQRLAERHHAPIPPLVHMHGKEDLPALGRLRYPAVLKPGARHDGYARQFRKAYRVESAAEAEALASRILPVMADIVVQEWIEGPDSNIHFCLQYINRNGEVTASFSGRKVRCWPPHVGGTASCRPAADAHAELSGLTTRFFRNAGVSGMAAMEYKRDARSGEFRMVEPTIGRTDYQAEVATLNGVNLPCAAWCAELGRPYAETRPARRPVAWRVRSEDLQSAAAQGQRAAHGFDGKVVDAWWRATDPIPSAVKVWRDARLALRTRMSRMRSGSDPVGSKS